MSKVFCLSFENRRFDTIHRYLEHYSNPLYSQFVLPLPSASRRLALAVVPCACCTSSGLLCQNLGRMFLQWLAVGSEQVPDRFCSTPVFNNTCSLFQQTAFQCCSKQGKALSPRHTGSSVLDTNQMASARV